MSLYQRATNSFKVFEHTTGPPKYEFTHYNDSKNTL